MPLSRATPPEPNRYKEQAKVALVDCDPSGNSTLISALVHNLVHTQKDSSIVRNIYASCVEHDPGTAVQFNLEPSIPTTTTTTTTIDFLYTQITDANYHFPHHKILIPPEPDLLLLSFPLKPLKNPLSILQDLTDLLLVSPARDRHIPKQVPILLVGVELDLAWREIMLVLPEGDGNESDDYYAADYNNQARLETLLKARGLAGRVVVEHGLDGYVECSAVNGEGVEGVVDAVLGVVYSDNRGVGGCYKSLRSGKVGDGVGDKEEKKKGGGRGCCTML